MAKVELGDTARCMITGFEGVVVGLVNYITGCTQCLLAPPVNDKGEPREAHWFDIQRVQRRDPPRIVLQNAATPGFDKAAPKR
jgi:hypothetical protein